MRAYIWQDAMETVVVMASSGIEAAVHVCEVIKAPVKPSDLVSVCVDQTVTIPYNKKRDPVYTRHRRRSSKPLLWDHLTDGK